jgi:hypothetical protein
VLLEAGVEAHAQVGGPSAAFFSPFFDSSRSTAVTSDMLRAALGSGSWPSFHWKVWKEVKSTSWS